MAGTEWTMDVGPDRQPFNSTRESLDLRPYIATREIRHPPRSICRVKPRLRELSRDQFEPEHLFLGLYHRSKNGENYPKTKGNLFRWAVVGAFLAEAGDKLSNWGDVCARIVRDPDAMKHLYRGEGLEEFSNVDVQSMLSLDALFLALFLSEYFGMLEVLTAFPSVMLVVEEGGQSFVQDLLLDIVKLENQIPLVLVGNAMSLLCETVDEKRRLEDEGDADDASLDAKEIFRGVCACMAAFFRDDLPGHSIGALDFDEKLGPDWSDECEHLLHCVHLAMVRVESSEPAEATHAIQALRKPLSRLHKAWGRSWKRCFGGRGTKSARVHRMAIRTNTLGKSIDIPLAPVTQLVKAGIAFRGHNGFDVRFEKTLFGATLHLPTIFYLGDNCEQLWRNLLAFENEYELGYRFMSYLDFMDNLIDSDADVEVLRSGKHPVFINVGVGSNDEVVKLFNTVTKGHFVKLNDEWRAVLAEISNYYNNERRQMWVEFRRTNLGKPWLFVSLVAAIVLLVLTVLQTVYTILAY